MFGRNFFRQRPGMPIPARANNRLAESAEGIGRGRPGTGGHQFTVMNGMPLWRGIPTSASNLAMAYPPGGGIPRGTGTYPNVTCTVVTCQLAVLNTSTFVYSLADPEQDVDVLNWGTSQDVGANKLIIIGFFNGAWHVMAEFCP